MKSTSSSVFINTSITKQFPNGPTVTADFQIIVCQNKNNEWIIECVEPLDIDEIVMMGSAIISLEGKRNFITHFKSIGIDLWDGLIKDMDEFIAMSGDTVTFVKEQTGIILPTKQSKPEPVVELTKQELDYVRIMTDLKQKFGSLGYYNDKRKEFRRIKIFSGPKEKIKQYMKKKYPNIETYFNEGTFWHGQDLCFRLPL